jgi:hypothetical protein
MKADDKDKKLDGLIRSAVGRDSLHFDFQQWQRDHQRQIDEFKSKVVAGGGARVSACGLVRRIIAARLSKLAVAAAILVGILLAAPRFVGSLDGTTAAYAKVMEAVKNVPWMHVQYAGYRLDEKGNKASEEGALDTEIWYSFNAQTVIRKYHGGHIVYSDYAKQHVHTYNPVSHRIILSALSGKRQPFPSDSPWRWLESNIKTITSSGGEVTRRTGQYQGQTVEIFEIVSATRPGVSAIRDKIFVDRTTFLPIAEERTFVNTDIGKPQQVEAGTFDYPEHGPADIYALGLPSDIPTIDSLPLPPWQEISVAYQSHYYQAPAEKYIAIVTRAMTIRGNPVSLVEVCYAEGARFRKERHFLYHKGPIGEQWEQLAGELGTTFDSILKWSRAYKAENHIEIRLFDRNHCYDSRRDEDGSWSMTEQTFEDSGRAHYEFWNLCPVAQWGWPEIRGEADIIQDDYARNRHLIRVEAQGEVFFLNPERDYICQSMLDINSNTYEVTEFAQTPEGRWYPAKVEAVGLLHTIYLVTNPQFPEGIFDPNRLPRADQ